MGLEIHSELRLNTSWSRKFSCANGIQELPFNLVEPEEEQLNVVDDLRIDESMLSLQFKYRKTKFFTYLQVLNPQPDSNNRHLQAIFFHRNSLHTVNGHRYPLELGFLYSSESASDLEDLVGISILAKLLKMLPTARCNFTETLNVDKLLPMDRSYFKYNASMHMPPCLQNVKRYVFESPIQVSLQQMLKDLFHNTASLNLTIV
ncbi:hypothetical protein HELRODRAFT_169452 [Helobdella robusta]|uniref:carbonic anhydrase n=1 Tax=Helobdella robusta TaxID=6412 RepID=T1F1Y5_HELRO|nr:hypothetical protein HELRODRAFT_169452 [Helobdella robusta]ESO08577.1 hypothetical protein HELRODRAFT_169452 [Helobdella robusta]